jgi:lysophospholipase L1-like esterase
MSGNFQFLTRDGMHDGQAKKGRGRRRLVLELEQMEKRTLLSVGPIRIGSLGDSLTDEYQFYAPDRPTAANWVEILSALRPTQVTFGAFSTTTRGETRNQGYAQNWARSGATAVGDDVAGAHTKFVNQYHGGDPPGAPGLLTQPGGLSNIDVVTILIGGNDYQAAIESTIKKILDYKITPADVTTPPTTILDIVEKEIGNLVFTIPSEILEGVVKAVDAIQAQNSHFPIVLISAPDPGDTPLVVDANAFLNTVLPASDKDILEEAFHGIAMSVTGALSQVAAQKGLKFVDLDSLFSSFIANPVINGTFINPIAGGPNYTDLFVGDDFHPGTVAQSILANAILEQIDMIFPGAITPLSNNEILAYAQAVQPVTKTLLTASAGSAATGAPITFTTQVFNFPDINSTTTAENYSAVPPTGTVTFIDTAQGNKLLGIASLLPVGNGPTYSQSVARFTTSSLGTGLHQVVAIYNGNNVYPAAPTATALTFVGTPAQTQLFSNVALFQSELGVQISEPQLNRWNHQLHAGAPPQHVARNIVRYVYYHTSIPRNQAVQLLRRARHG